MKERCYGIRKQDFFTRLLQRCYWYLIKTKTKVRQKRLYRIRGNNEKGMCHLCLEEEDNKNILLEGHKLLTGEKKCSVNNG